MKGFLGHRPSLVADESSPPAGRAPPAVESPHGRKANAAIAEWQRCGYDPIAPFDAASRQSTGVGPDDAAASAVDRLRARIGVACHGAGAGASMGLLRSIFRRFDASGDGVISRDELRTGLELTGVDFSRSDYDAVMADMDVDRDGTVTLLELAHAICGGFGADATQHAYYATQRRPPKDIDALRDAMLGVSVSLLGDIFKELRRARGFGRAVPAAVLADEIARKALVDLTAADLDVVATDGLIALDDLYERLFAE